MAPPAWGSQQTVSASLFLLTFNGLFLFVGYVRSAAYPFARAEWPGAWWGLVGSREPGRFRGLGVASFFPTEKALSCDRCLRQRCTDSRRLNTGKRQSRKLENGSLASPIGLLLGASALQAVTCCFLRSYSQATEGSVYDSVPR